MNFKKLEKWWWSPEHPFKYVAINPESELPSGVGLLMRKSPEAWTRFNLVWAVYGEQLKTWNGAVEGVGLCINLRPKLDRPAEGGTLGELSCLYSQAQFLQYCKKKNIKLGLPRLQNT